MLPVADSSLLYFCWQWIQWIHKSASSNLSIGWCYSYFEYSAFIWTAYITGFPRRECKHFQHRNRSPHAPPKSVLSNESAKTFRANLFFSPGNKALTNVPRGRVHFLNVQWLVGGASKTTCRTVNFRSQNRFFPVPGDNNPTRIRWVSAYMCVRACVCVYSSCTE